MRGYFASASDYHDCLRIAYGGENLDDVHKRYFTSANRRTLIKGVFEKSYPYGEVRDKIHALGFILEKNYTANEIKAKTILLPNLNLKLNDSEKVFLKKLFEKW